MQASAYQMMRAEIKQLEKTVAQLGEANGQLVAALQSTQAQLLGERCSVKILTLLNGGSVTAPKALIDEVGARPYAFDAALSKDAETGDQTITVTKKSDEQIAAIEAELQARQDAMKKAMGEQQSAEAIVAPDGRPARESAGKLVVVQ